MTVLFLETKPLVPVSIGVHGPTGNVLKKTVEFIIHPQIVFKMVNALGQEIIVPAKIVPTMFSNRLVQDFHFAFGSKTVLLSPVCGIPKQIVRRVHSVCGMMFVSLVREGCPAKYLK